LRKTVSGPTIKFLKQKLVARLADCHGEKLQRPIEVRTNPVTGRRCRITFSRSLERERGTEQLPGAPPDALGTESCPFCRSQLDNRTPCLSDQLYPQARLKKGRSVLFPNLFPYGAYSAVSIFGDEHFVEIGKASVQAYADSFENCIHYLQIVQRANPQAVFMAVAQNFLPAAGGSLVHPHLQVHADQVASNHHRFLQRRAAGYRRKTGRKLLADYLEAEKADQTRYIGRTGNWHWMAAFAPEGFFEIWAINPGVVSLFEVSGSDWCALSQGILNVQRFYRSLNRNSYNLGLLSIEHGHQSDLELRCVLVARSNYAPWVRSDHTSYEVMLGDCATFNAPEETAAMARPFWAD
jgi:galactose-1-phosphate uridylyltransferase